HAHICCCHRPPGVPSFPKKTGILAISGLGYFCLAFLGCLLKDRMQTGFTNSNQLEELQLPVLGIVPRLPNRVLRRENPHEYLIRRPVSAYSEACRSIWTSLNLQSPNRIRSVL